MRVALLSDTHGFVDPRIAERVTECDIAVHAGDIGGADVLLSLQPREELVAIRGNNDTPERWSEGERHVLDTLPAETALDLPGGRLVVLHGDDSGTLAQRGRRYRRRF
ncbi:metallophosphoesterase family protein, partial [Arhodomonas sp. KWT]